MLRILLQRSDSSLSEPDAVNAVIRGGQKGDIAGNGRRPDHSRRAITGKSFRRRKFLRNRLRRRDRLLFARCGDARQLRKIEAGLDSGQIDDAVSDGQTAYGVRQAGVEQQFAVGIIPLRLDDLFQPGMSDAERFCRIGDVQNEKSVMGVGAERVVPGNPHTPVVVAEIVETGKGKTGKTSGVKRIFDIPHFETVPVSRPFRRRPGFAMMPGRGENESAANIQSIAVAIQLQRPLWNQLCRVRGVRDQDLARRPVADEHPIAVNFDRLRLAGQQIAEMTRATWIGEVDRFHAVNAIADIGVFRRQIDAGCQLDGVITAQKFRTGGIAEIHERDSVLAAGYRGDAVPDRQLAGTFQNPELREQFRRIRGCDVKREQGAPRPCHIKGVPVQFRRHRPFRHAGNPFQWNRFPVFGPGDGYEPAEAETEQREFHFAFAWLPLVHRQYSSRRLRKCLTTSVWRPGKRTNPVSAERSLPRNSLSGTSNSIQ